MTTIRDRNIFEKIEKSKVLTELKNIFGDKYVSEKVHNLYPYSYDMTESPAHMPDFVVLPEKVQEIISLVKFCNEYSIPIIPYGTGNNVGGLTIPEQGGIILDMGKRMKKIIKIHESMMYAIVEPGVTFGQLKKHLDENYPNLKYGYTYAPPYASVGINTILSGMTNLSCCYGCTADWINGLEVVLNNGDLVRTGSCFISKEFKPDNWFVRYPIPDLSSLFVCWQGTTGIVTKMGIQLWPNKPYNDALLAIGYGWDECAEIVREIGRTECCEDVAAINLPGVAKMTFGLEEPKKLEKEPDFGIFILVSGQTQEILNAKIKYIHEVFHKIKEKTDKELFLTNYFTFANLLGEKFSIFYNLPSVITPLVEWNGVTWVGSYASVDNTGILLKKCNQLFEKYQKTPVIFMKNMKYSHYCTILAAVRYDKSTELEKVIQLQNELLDVMLEHNCIPYKAPVWMVKKIKERADPNWFKLLERLKNTMDSKNIFNPGKWTL